MALTLSLTAIIDRPTWKISVYYPLYALTEMDLPHVYESFVNKFINHMAYYLHNQVLVEHIFTLNIWFL